MPRNWTAALSPTDFVEAPDRPGSYRLKPPAASVSLPPAVTTPVARPPYWPYKSQLEWRYSVLLDEWQTQGKIRRWRYECLTLRLGHRQTLTFDFWLTMPDGTYQLHDTKGYMRADWWEKAKMAAREYDDLRMFVVRYADLRWTWDEIPTV